MKTLASVAILIFLIVSFVMYRVGYNIKKWQTWAYAIYGFLTFLFAGLVGKTNLLETIIGSIVLVLVVIFGSAMTKWSKDRADALLQEDERKRK